MQYNTLSSAPLIISMIQHPRNDQNRQSVLVNNFTTLTI